MRFDAYFTEHFKNKPEYIASWCFRIIVLVLDRDTGYLMFQMHSYIVYIRNYCTCTAYIHMSKIKLFVSEGSYISVC